MRITANWDGRSDNSLRAHLQEALREREASTSSDDFGYSDRDVADIHAEIRSRATTPRRR